MIQDYYKRKIFSIFPSLKYERKSFEAILYQIYEGKTISFIDTDNLWDEKVLVQ